MEWKSGEKKCKEGDADEVFRMHHAKEGRSGKTHNGKDKKSENEANMHGVGEKDFSMKIMGEE